MIIAVNVLPRSFFTFRKLTITIFKNADPVSLRCSMVDQHLALIYMYISLQIQKYNKTAYLLNSSFFVHTVPGSFHAATKIIPDHRASVHTQERF